MAEARISHFSEIKNCGIFQSYKYTDSDPTFKKYNIIFGFNGTGKTTLSRVLRSYELGRVGDELPKSADFSLVLNDGRTVSSLANIDAISSRIRVFNADFVVESLRWSEATAKPVFYIGPDVARRSRLLERLRKRLPKRLQQRETADAVRQEREKALAKKKTDLAREINQSLKLTTYNAPKLSSDIESAEIAAFRVLSDDEFRATRQIALQDSRLNELTIDQIDAKAISASLEVAKDLISTTIGDVVLGDFKSHSQMMKWAKDGLEYHEAHLLDQCLFCGNAFTERRRQSLHQIFDQNLERFFNTLTEMRNTLEEQNQYLRFLRNAVPHADQLAADLVKSFDAEAKNAVAVMNSLDFFVQAVIDSIDNKIQDPVTVAELEFDSAQSNIRSLDVSLSRMGAIVDKHNVAQAEFHKTKARAINKYKYSLILAEQKELEQMQSSVGDAKSELERRTKLLSRLQLCIEELERVVRSHGPAVSDINRLLVEYLGHDEISLAVRETGYELRRGGVRLVGPLSEGERTAIALCYFLSKLREDGRDISDFIVVVDDPVSSLDFSALYYAHNLIRTHLQDANQIILMTHNLDLLNEAKRWMRMENERVERANKGKNEKKELPCEFFGISLVVGDGNTRRKSMLVKMPKMLRVYGSEYHYLFSILFRFRDAGGVTGDANEFMIPHVIRRALELFLAFKIPGSEGLEEKLKYEIIKKSGVSTERLFGMTRLAHAGSHSENIDGFVRLLPISMEESLKATKALFDLVTALDEFHFQRLSRICRG